MKELSATDLRIGNLVFGKYEDDNEVEQSVLCRVLALDETGEMLDYKIWVETFGSSNQEYFDGFEPIPLTEEWLLRFGFETDEITFWKSKLNIGHFKTGYYYLPCGLSGVKGIEVQSVHQLQNLYHALTGEELT